MKWNRDDIGDYTTEDGRGYVDQTGTYRRLGVEPWEAGCDGFRIGYFWYLCEAKAAVEEKIDQ